MIMVKKTYKNLIWLVSCKQIRNGFIWKFCPCSINISNDKAFKF